MPSHELISRFSTNFTQHRLTLNDTQAQVWLRGQNLPGNRMPLPSSEQLVLVEDSEHRFLGRGKVDGDELKNLLPKWL
jgi:NOL1/NOP2/fmu family ribosome biogenesis protein